MVYYFALRVDLLAEVSLIALVGFVTKWSTSHVVVREAGDETGKDHIHALLVCDENCKLQSVRMDLRRKFPALTGNKAAYSLSEVKDLEKYERYLCKGASADEQPRIVSTEGLRYDDMWKSDMHEAYWRLNFQHQQDISESKKQKLSFTDFLEVEAKKRKILWSDPEKLRDLYIELSFSERRGVLNKNQIDSVVNQLIGRLCPDDRAVQFVRNRIFGEFVGLESAGLQRAEPFL